VGSAKRVLIAPVSPSNTILRIAEPSGLTTPVLSDDGTGPVWIEGDGLSTTGVGEGRPASAGGVTAYVLPGNIITSLSTSSPATGSRFYQPIIVREPVSLTALVGEVTAGNGASRAMRVGLYEADWDWTIGALLIEGEFDASTTGVKTVAASPAITLNPGRYLTAYEVNDGTPTWRIWQTPALWFSTGSSGVLRGLKVTTSPGYGTLPDPGTAWDAFFAASGTALQIHFVVLAVDPA
jgi:hypothetical protein